MAIKRIWLPTKNPLTWQICSAKEYSFASSADRFSANCQKMVDYIILSAYQASNINFIPESKTSRSIQYNDEHDQLGDYVFRFVTTATFENHDDVTMFRLCWTVDK